ncbi:hypothetical protein [Paracoccus methylarcula]|uniref:DUF4123 domain-containing protein n=1 Tax=Paracoccus methylarcula TaxID=72022 RepID=A0A422QU86_9RHOB|nr:hypothetical protein [Paracoccus methylarcula]RNF33565.1 hypothetical protein A7A09_015750 [Paracoccus methylarcula]
MAMDQRRRELLIQLTQLAQEPDSRVYAVMDGAVIDGLKMKCREADLECRALYRHDGDPAVVLGGPWIVNPYRDWIGGEKFTPPAWATEWESGALTLDDLNVRMNAAIAAGDPSGGGITPFDDVRNAPATISRLDRILSIADDKPGLVFWIGDAALTDEVLYQHLRRLNKVLVPKDQDEPNESQAGELSVAAADPEEIPAPPRGAAHELVLFRHADANVMAQVIPALNAAQLSRLLGPCRQILCAPGVEWADGVLSVDRLEDWPPPHSGPLRFDAETMRAMNEMRMEGSRRKVMSYLREVDPGGIENLSDAELRHRVMICEKTGKEMGLESEQAHMKWAYLMSITGGRADQDGVAKAHFQGSYKHPDDAIDDVLDELDEALGG